MTDIKKLQKRFKGLAGSAKEAIEDLKARLLSPPILAHPDFTKPFEVHCDGSKEGLGATLTQIQGGKERIIAYASRSLRDYEKKWFPY